MTYSKPKPRPGLVCWFVRWNPDGTIREARFRPREREASPEPILAPVVSRTRGLVATSAPASGQGLLL